MKALDTEAAVTADTFPERVLRSPVPVLVDFWAPGCAPCVALAPILEELAVEYGDRLRVVKVNVDDAPEQAVELGLKSVPTLVLFRDGAALEKLTGARPKAELRKWINSHLGL